MSAILFGGRRGWFRTKVMSRTARPSRPGAEVASPVACAAVVVVWWTRRPARATHRPCRVQESLFQPSIDGPIASWPRLNCVVFPRTRPFHNGILMEKAGWPPSASPAFPFRHRNITQKGSVRWPIKQPASGPRRRHTSAPGEPPVRSIIAPGSREPLSRRRSSIISVRGSALPFRLSRY
ncbi:uncharacterized protein J3D65DRAFT_107776 [Phyllosticta citribraziliensis]|uniref:Uncharacterized protein n=1 Tax=Phyllosticta citribraziliensis TaxID=989973 RepID=A0ABR1LB65_9PEZI